MDFLKNNLFYVILIAVVLVVSIPSYMLASSRNLEAKQAESQVASRLRSQQGIVRNLKPVSAAALARAEEFQKEWADQIAKVQSVMKRGDSHLDNDFLIRPPEGKPVPLGEEYKAAYNAAYAELNRRLVAAGLAEVSSSPLPKKVQFGGSIPNKYIRISQKEYWILKEFVDVLVDPDCHITKVSGVGLDARINADGSLSRPDNMRNPEQSTFWRYPVKFEIQMDFRYFRVFLDKLINNENITFVPDGYKITRAFDESEPIFVPLVAVSLYGAVWDYISTDFELAMLKEVRPARGGGGGGNRGGGNR